MRHRFHSPQEQLPGRTPQRYRLGPLSPFWLNLLFLSEFTASHHRMGNLGSQTHLPVRGHQEHPGLHPFTSKKYLREEKLPTFLSKAGSVMNSNRGDFRKRNVTAQRNRSILFNIYQCVCVSHTVLLFPPGAVCSFYLYL